MIYKKIIRNSSIFLYSLMIFSVINASHAKENFEGYLQNCIDELENKDGDVSTNTASGQAGSWTEEGTKANEIAIEMWDYWEGKGFSGAAIASVMGNVAHEGGFDIPDRAEGHYG